MAVGDKILASSYYSRSPGDLIVSYDAINVLDGTPKAIYNTILESDVRRKMSGGWNSLTDRRAVNGPYRPTTASITNPSGDQIRTTVEGYQSRVSATTPYTTNSRSPYFISGNIYAPTPTSSSGSYDFGFFTYSGLPHYGWQNTQISVNINLHYAQIRVICIISGSTKVNEIVMSNITGGLYQIGIGMTVGQFSDSSFNLNYLKVYINSFKKSYSIGGQSVSDDIVAGIEHEDSSDYGGSITYTLSSFNAYYNYES